MSLGYVLAAVAAFVLTGAWLAGSVVGWLPLETMVWAGALFTAAFVMLIPILLGPVASAGAVALRPLLGAEAAVAQRQLLRRRVRTTLTIGVLYMAVSTAIAMGTTIMNNVREVRNWHAHTMSGDFFVRALQVDPASGTAITMPEELGAQIRAVDGVTNVDTIRFVRDVKAMGQSVLLMVRDFTDRDTLPIELKEGSPEQLRERLARGEAVISTVLAQRHGLHVGDTFPMRTRHGERQIAVAGTTNAYLVGGSVIYMQGAHARQLLNIEGVDVFVVQVARDKLAEAEAALQQLCDRHGVMLHSFADLRQMLDAILDGVIGSLWGLVAVGFVMAAFGVANTLTINVLEQTCELAMLRVVAMTRAQVRRTILGQAAIIGLIGLTTGAIGGLSGSYVMNLCSLRMLGHVVAFSLNPIMVAACFLLGLAVVLLAAWAPAERAARLNLLLALQYE
jgi:putative ABC transport system permease protein